MRAFHNEPAVKEKYLARVRAHAAADRIVKGQYWDGGKGCAIGCTIEGNDHTRYETELGLPEWLARLEDTLFEGLPNAEAMTFPERFLSSIPVGAILEGVKWKFCAFILKENIERVLTLEISDALKEQVVGAIRQALAVHESAIATGTWDEAAAWSAESAAWSAWWSAWSAAWSAWSAAWSAARSAARSAESAAHQRYADHLIELLASAPTE